MSASFNPLALLAERTCGPIYNAIDSGNNILAIRHADKILKSQPDLALASALKSIALVRAGKHADANAVCDALLKRGLRRGEEGIIPSLSWSLGRLGRREDEVELLEAAAKANPNDEDLGRQAFMSLTKTGSYQKAQQLSFKMHKTFAGKNGKKGRFVDEYFWWSIQSYLLLARNPSAPGAALSLPLSQRMIEKQIESKALGLNDEEALWLQLQVLIKQNKRREAFELISRKDSIGDQLCDRNLKLEFLRIDLAKELDEWQYIEDRSRRKVETGSRNWAHLVAFLESAAKLGESHLAQAEQFVKQLASSSEGMKDRSLRLAELELLRQKKEAGQEVEGLYDLTCRYVDQFGTKACCHEDLLPYLGLLSESTRVKLSEHLQQKRKQVPIKTEDDLRVNISISKIQRTVQSRQSMSEEAESQLSSQLAAEYLDGLSVGKALPETEMQPADDLALLSAQALLSAYVISGFKLSYLLQTIALLEFALVKSKKGYQLRMLLIRAYMLAGAFDRASTHFNLIGIKSVQFDTLSYLVSDRTSSFSATASSAGDDALSKMVIRTFSTAQGIYDENNHSTPDMISKAFEHGIYSQVEEFVDFGDMLNRSLQRQILRLEQARSHLHNRKNYVTQEDKESFDAGIKRAAEAVVGDLKIGLHDQRDFLVLVNYQPLGTPSIEELTRTGPRQNAGWVKSIVSVLSRDEAIQVSDDDKKELTAEEREMVELLVKLQKGQFNEAEFLGWLETTKAQLKAWMDGLTDASEAKGRPMDVIHTAGIVLETCYHVSGHLKEEAKTTARAHLAEISTLLNHLSRSTAAIGQSDADKHALVLQQGLSSLGSEQVTKMVQSTHDNLARSWKKVFDNLRDALRDAL